jgi:STIP1 family protein 1
MEDPVITPAGHSYERKAIEEAIQKSGRDPLTQENLQVADLRTNRSLKEAIEEYKKGKGKGKGRGKK